MKRKALYLLVVSVMWINSGKAQTAYFGNDSLLVIQEGIASYYGKKFHQKQTASGEIFDMHDYTAAHKHLPFGTLLKVTNQENGFEVIVKINDRLPQRSRRIIDLSRSAAQQLDMIDDGLTPVKLTALSFQEIEKIKNYYEVTPKELRLRVHYEPVRWDHSVDIFPPLSLQKRKGYS